MNEVRKKTLVAAVRLLPAEEHPSSFWGVGDLPKAAWPHVLSGPLPTTCQPPRQLCRRSPRRLGASVPTQGETVTLCHWAL
jgi:hypothetical protein